MITHTDVVNTHIVSTEFVEKAAKELYSKGPSSASLEYYKYIMGTILKLYGHQLEPELLKDNTYEYPELRDSNQSERLADGFEEPCGPIEVFGTQNILNTKYRVTDKVWILTNKKALECSIGRIIMKIVMDEKTKEPIVSIHYNLYLPVNYQGKSNLFAETELFKSKQELIDSL